MWYVWVLCLLIGVWAVLMLYYEYRGRGVARLCENLKKFLAKPEEDSEVLPWLRELERRHPRRQSLLSKTELAVLRRQCVEVQAKQLQAAWEKSPGPVTSRSHLMDQICELQAYAADVLGPDWQEFLVKADQAYQLGCAELEQSRWEREVVVMQDRLREVHAKLRAAIDYQEALRFKFGEVRSPVAISAFPEERAVRLEKLRKRKKDLQRKLFALGREIYDLEGEAG